MLPRRFLRPWPETLQESLRIQFFRHGFTQQRGISQRLRYAGSGGEGSEKRRLLQCTTIRRKIIPETAWNQIGPMLDQLVDDLGEIDRRAILLRFIEHRSFAEAGNRSEERHVGTECR